MKNVLTILLGIACAAVLIYGHSYWNQRIEAAPPKTTESPKSQKTTTEANENQELDSNLIAYTANWPKAAVERFKKTHSEKKPFKILFVGSPAIGSDTAGTYPIVKEKLLTTFGEKNVQVAIKTYNSISTQVIKNKGQEEIAAEEADLVVFEPFILLNNGNVFIQNTFDDITTMIDAVKAKNPDATIILQPSYPLYNAKIYPHQVAQLKQFAEQQQISYLNHWTAWPDASTEAIKEYLSPDQSAPSEKGDQVWSAYLLNFLISKSESS
ncbi:hypothetical protein QFZ87_000749 [Bacillus sp. SLBN-46]|uniref:SGNH/GDSL hydrolase family protein n=1 Tax=Bacillus sp. SLBN-46 TaxID=3042283 RepID=UPI0028599A9A|nr:SGNH/GDSL hydrolase family protein [Bacillus sp. SLBN-46]MDR6121152.1 hypothetical protein [Bacillus sp. SLBN-46]